MGPIWAVLSAPLRHAELVSASIMPNIQSKPDRRKLLGFLTKTQIGRAKKWILKQVQDDENRAERC
jgi:hypothetical protein